MEYSNELEELAAEAAEELKTKLEGAESKPVKPGTLSEILDALQEGDDDADPHEELNTAQASKK